MGAKVRTESFLWCCIFTETSWVLHLRFKNGLRGKPPSSAGSQSILRIELPSTKQQGLEQLREGPSDCQGCKFLRKLAPSRWDFFFFFYNSNNPKLTFMEPLPGIVLNSLHSSYQLRLIRCDLPPGVVALPWGEHTAPSSSAVQSPP